MVSKKQWEAIQRELEYGMHGITEKAGRAPAMGADMAQWMRPDDADVPMTVRVHAWEEDRALKEKIDKDRAQQWEIYRKQISIFDF